MKKIIFALAFFTILSGTALSSLFGQYNPDRCLSDQLPEWQTDVDSTPKYLRPGWGQVKYEKLAIVYIDFPDGRWNDNGVLKQPYTTSELELVPNKGAAAEVGLTFDTSSFPIGNGLYMNASKYNYYNRWDLYFSQAFIMMRRILTGQLTETQLMEV